MKYDKILILSMRFNYKCKYIVGGIVNEKVKYEFFCKRECTYM